MMAVRAGYLMRTVRREAVVADGEKEHQKRTSTHGREQSPTRKKRCDQHRLFVSV
jgi:hypothetical protein